MSAIEASVGQDGENREPDVRVVQRLLNGQDLAPLATLAEDGRSGSRTVEAIRHFQTRQLGMQSPDGRVDPDGRTIRKLSSGPKNERGTGENAETRKADRSLRAERVDPRVQETAVTTRIIDGLVPEFGNTRAKIIAGYLSDADQFWKVNYHWEYLLQMVDHSLTLQVDDADRKELQSIRSTLMSCSPDPSSGYASSPIGKPVDRSSIDDVINRYKLLKGAKESFRKVTDRADLKGKSTRSPTMFYLAAAPIAFPGTSKHGTGYAVDIAGDNASIKSLCSGLGATLVFDEKSHVHVEFKNGLGR
jgi:hypothetical protein